MATVLVVEDERKLQPIFMARDCTGNPRQPYVGADTACVTSSSCGNTCCGGGVRERSILNTPAASRSSYIGTLDGDNDYDAELRYDRLPIGAVQGLDPQRVVYGGTVSKVLSPALRLGWLVAQLVDDVVRAKFLDDVASEALGQLTLARFIDSGAFARHLRRVRPIYRSRRDRLPADLAAHLPEIHPSGEAAGLHLLLRLPAELDAGALLDAAAKHGIRLEEAARNWADHNPQPPALLVGYGALRDSTLGHGIKALAAELHTARRRRSGVARR